MTTHRLYTLAFAAVYTAYLNKLQRKGRTPAELDRVIGWLTGYDAPGLHQQLEAKTDVQTFLARAPALNPNRALIKGLICGVRVEEVQDPLMQQIRQLDKLVDELAKGRPMDKVLRA